MAITLDGTVGVTSPDFIPSSSNIPTNGLFLPAANTVGLATGSTERLRIDSSGNLGIGTSSPTYKLDVSSAASSTIARFTGGSSSVGFFQNNLGANNSYFALGVDATGSTVGWSTGGIFISSAANGTGTAYDLILQQYMAKSIIFATSNTERARIDASGNLLVGTTNTDPAGNNVTGAAIRSGTTCSIQNGSSTALTLGSSANNTYLQGFRNAGNLAGYISVPTANTTTYNSVSDQRLKENIVDAPSAIDSINAIKVRSFDWKIDGVHVDYGWIAQELLEVAPEAVSASDDPEEMMGVDFGRLTPRLVKAIQELTARLEALENK